MTTTLEQLRSNEMQESYPQERDEIRTQTAEQLTEAELETTSHEHFLDRPLEQRLQYITKNKVGSSRLLDKTVGELEFTFTFNGNFNKELHEKTTAGQVLPKQVEKVETGGTVYTRIGLYGEFFSEDNKRLIINEGTKLSINQLRSSEETVDYEEVVTHKVERYLQEHPSAEREIVSMSIERNVDPDLAVLAFSNFLKGADRKLGIIMLEDALTEIDRIAGALTLARNSGNKVTDRVAIEVFKKYTDNWEEKARRYGLVINNQSQVSESNIRKLNNIKTHNGNLSYIPRLQDTQNIAEDLNNPANLVAGGIGDKFAIGKVKSGASNGRTFLVFANVEQGFAAMAEDIKAKQTGNSSVIKPNESLNTFIDTWVGNDGTENTKARVNYKNTVISELQKNGVTVNLNTNFSRIDPLLLAKSLSKAEGFKGGNNLYENYRA